MAIHLALGSWSDPDYAGLTYPRGLTPDLRLSAYAMWFDRVEVNATYYSLPKTAAVIQWLAATPPSFKFHIRLHRVISQGPAKAATSNWTNWTLERLAPLLEADRLGAFLLVLPPLFAPERRKLEELDGIIDALRPHSLAIELRHRDWIEGEARATTLEYFRSRRVTWVAVDMPRIVSSDLMPAIDDVTDPRLAYLRLHGRNPKWAKGKTAEEKHTYAYTEGDLAEIVARIRTLAASAETVQVVANNHARDFAPRTALALKEKLGLF